MIKINAKLNTMCFSAIHVVDPFLLPLTRKGAGGIMFSYL